ncbi:MAG: NAD(P)-dependent oxidoreductase [Erythrobacter sp.]|nr:NAD(P)-dependent oxidoreductase [Erythrobacter sp.]
MSTNPQKILVLGASGMLGSAVLRYFAAQPDIHVTGMMRSCAAVQLLPEAVRDFVVTGIDVENTDQLTQLFARARPNLVINCIGLIKQLSDAKDPLAAIPINSILPHRLARLCELLDARLVHLSTDCVFSGDKGSYTEADVPDARDVYGRTKLLGEVDYPNAITLRTSIIGHELSSSKSLLNWFLSQRGTVNGFTRAVFSGLPTVEIARVIHQLVMPNPNLRGLYHLSVAPINKFDLLKLFAKAYGKQIEVVPNDNLVIDRSLDSTRFREATGFVPPSWPELIDTMRNFG